MITNKDIHLMADLLGKPEITWKKRGIHICSSEDSRMERLFTMGLATKEETEEPWGHTIWYRLTDRAKKLILKFTV